MINILRLTEVLSTPSVSGDEDRMRDYIVNSLNERNIHNYTDKYGNVYAVKGNTEHFPCVIAHIDTVHPITDFTVVEDNYTLSAIKPDGSPTGIGGDNKAGVFVCLELLDRFDNIKAAFFVSEEVGCLGSYLSDPEFFENVGYAMQFDAPFNNWVSHYSDGVKLFSTGSEFFNKIHPIFEECLPGYGLKTLGNHPYTDVSALKSLYDFSCVNFSVGYYNMHSIYEYVSILDVELCLDTAKKLIESLGEELYFLPKANKRVLNESTKIDLEKRLNYYKQKKGLI
jgi:putative aminopeptidase FrvX